VRVRGSDDLGALGAPELDALEHAALGEALGTSPLGELEERQELFEMDRAGIGTPLGDLGSSEVTSP
jgi:hypothetical protein